MKLKLQLLIIFFFYSCLLMTKSLHSQETKPNQISFNQNKFPLYPKTLDKLPEIPSPFTTKDGIEILLALMKDNKYALIPVTVENGDPFIGEIVGGELIDISEEAYSSMSSIAMGGPNVKYLKFKGYKKEGLIHLNFRYPNATLPYEVGKFYKFDTSDIRLSGAHSGEFIDPELNKLEEIDCES